MLNRNLWATTAAISNIAIKLKLGSIAEGSAIDRSFAY
jgi:hypothetical protein